MKGFIQILFIGFFITLGHGNLTFANPPPNKTSPLGMNTNEGLEVDASLPFVICFDWLYLLMKHAHGSPKATCNLIKMAGQKTSMAARPERDF
jgi:hypothetical protein